MKIGVVTVASHPQRGYWLFQESCARWGIVPVVLGLGEPYRQNTDKILYLQRFLSQVSDDLDYMLFCDAYDVIVGAELSRIVERYFGLKSPLVFSAEKTCWPDANLASRYPECATPYRFLNSGLWMGEVGAAKKLVERLARRVTDSRSRSDQRLYTEAYLSSEFPMVLDYRCSVFQSLHLALDDLELNERGEPVRNKMTCGQPLIFHGNGGSNMYSLLSLFQLIPTYHESLDKAVRMGLMSENQYRYVSNLIMACEPCRTLVIGAGHDTELWYQCCRGNMACLEDSAEWFPRLPCRLVRPEYQGKIGEWLPEREIPKAIARLSWDVVIVDGPKGDTPDSPGRQETIFWASRLGARFVLVQDYERDWERQLCGRYLGQPSQIVPFVARDNRLLAVFDRSNQSPKGKTVCIL